MNFGNGSMSTMIVYLPRLGLLSFTNTKLPANFPFTTIEHALQMKARDITPADVVKIASYIPDFTLRCLRLTVSCNLCGKICDVPAEASYLCDNCHNYTISTAKMFFYFTTTDGTGTLKLATNSRTAEQLLNIKSSDLYNMPDKDRSSFVNDLSTALRVNKTEMVLSPVQNFLTDHNKLVWKLKERL